MSRMHYAFRPRPDGSVHASGVSKRFGDTRALNAVTLSLPAGSVAALIGHNGSGKTTILRLLAGVLDPDEGEIRVAGEPPDRGHTGFAAAGDRGLHWRLTGDQNLRFFAQVAGAPPAGAALRARVAAEALGAGELLPRRVGTCSTGQRRRLAIARAFVANPSTVLLDGLGLAHAADRNPRDLSGGERERAALAAVLVAAPRVLLLDEPTRGMDQARKRALGGLLVRLRGEGATILLATHDVELAAAIGSRVLLLGDGDVVADGAPRVVLSGSLTFATQINKLYGGRFLTVEDVLQGLSAAPRGREPSP